MSEIRKQSTVDAIKSAAVAWKSVSQLSRTISPKGASAQRRLSNEEDQVDNGWRKLQGQVDCSGEFHSFNIINVDDQTIYT